jgi:serine/threonine-protein kinase
MADESDKRVETERLLPEAQAGFQETLPAVVPPPAQRMAPPGAAPRLTERYEDLGAIGRGGMGEVRLCRDHRIGRRIALKVIREQRRDEARAQSRFHREARVQGQLEHPSIVPVYDLDTAPDGRMFFTMKRVAGRTIEQIIAGLREADPELERAYSRRRLLSAFNQVCLAVEYAHERGVLHRDLKPANVMLGDFGEVYVLDWGLAKLGDEDELEPTDGPISSDGQPLPHAATADGEVLGTPGYMAPEQIDGPNRAVDARSDVYALGAILFEILTLQPLHPRESAHRALGSTIAGADARAHVRAPDRQVPPELEAICVRATADQPGDRFASARELHDAVERFLDGDRDLALRREMAAKWADKAHVATVRALATEADHATRRRALALVSRALALDPEQPTARNALLELLVTPPAEVPPEALEQVVQSQRAADRTAARGGAMAFALWVGFVPIFMLLGIRDTVSVTAMTVLVTVGAVVSFLGSRAPAPERWQTPTLLLTTIALVFLSRLCGPYVLVPGLAAANAVSFSLHSDGARRGWFVALSAMAMVVPVTAELTGLIAPSYVFTDQGMVILPHLTDLPELSTHALLVLANLAVIVAPALLMSRTRNELRAAQHRLALYAWQMRQLVPDHDGPARSSMYPGRPMAPAGSIPVDASRGRT